MSNEIDDRKIIDELHQYLWSTMTLWLQWFTFFATVNYLAIGWFAQEIGKTGKLTDKHPLIYVSALFISQSILGIIASMI